MKFYRTKENNLINLEKVIMVYRQGETGPYSVVYENGQDYYVPELDDEDIDRIMEYNNHFID